MPPNPNNQGLLSSWKEIADYLGCDERTSRRWELEYGLPVHRMEGAARSRVYAYKDELDTWRKQKLNGNEAAAGTPGLAPSLEKREGALAAKGHPHIWKIKKILLWFIPLAAIITAMAVLLTRSSSGQPADFKINGTTLVILDKKGKDLWDFDTKLDNLISEQEYRRFFEIRSLHPWGRPILPRLIIKDINHDRKKEILFCPLTKDEYDQTGLYCFNSAGKELWHYKPGREHVFGEHTYSDYYRIYGLDLFDINNDGNLEVYLITSHQPHSPSELIALYTSGKAYGEFANWGRIHDIAFADLDIDGKKEVIIAGMSDEYGKGFLAVFDSDRISGSSPQGEKYACKDCGPGSEKYYILFPRTDVDIILKPDKVSIEAIHLLQPDRIELLTGISQIFIELDYRLEVQDIKGSDFFNNQHRELRAAGKITSELNDAYYENLKKGVLYWDGTQWTSTPKMNLKAKSPR